MSSSLTYPNHSGAMHECRKVVLLFASLILTLFAAEIVFRIYFRFFPNYDMEMWRYALNLKTGVDDDRSHIHIPNAHSTLMGVPVRINSKGFRDDEYAYKKPDGVYRILVVGDSFTLGWGVLLEETFPKALERRLQEMNKAGAKYSQIEVLNTGIGNYNTLQELAFLRVEGLKYAPDEILLAYYLNDAEDTQEEKGFFPVKRSAICAFLVSLKNKILAVYDTSRRYDNYYRNLYEGKRWVKHQKILKDFIGEIKKHNIKLSVLLLPEFHDFKEYPFKTIHRKVAGFFEGYGYPVIDALECFHGKDANQFWAADDDPHPNAAAHGMIAELVFEKMKGGFLK